MTARPATMAVPGRRDVILGGALLAAAVTAGMSRPRITTAALPDGALDRAVPMRLGPYRFAGTTGLIVPPPEETPSDIYDQVLTRIYIAPARPPVMLLIAYGSAQNATLALHRPEVCYPASGYAIGDDRRVPLAGWARGMANTLVAARGDRVEQIYYWTRIGDAFPTSRLDEKLAVVSDNLRGTLPDGVLVRLSIRSIRPDAALMQMMAFNQLLLGAVTRGGQRLLLGAGIAA